MTANKFDLELEPKEKPKEENDWQSFETAVTQVLGSTQERMERNTQDRPGDKIGQSFYDKDGNEIRDLVNFKNGQPVLNAIRGDKGQQILEVYANKNAALSGTPLLREAFSYEDRGNRTVEHREVSSPNHPTTKIETSFDKNSLSLSFRVQSGGTKQEIVIDANSNPTKFEITDGKSLLSYKFANGQVIGAEVLSGSGKRALHGSELNGFALAAEQSLDKLRSANGLPAPFAQGFGEAEQEGFQADGGFDAGIDPRSGSPRGISTSASIFGEQTIQDNRTTRHDRIQKYLPPHGMDGAAAKALDEVFGGFGNGTLSPNPDVGHHGINNGYTRLYFFGNDNDRKASLRGLEDEVLGGDNGSALQVLKDLSLVDGVRQLRTASSREEQLEALKKLAALETGDKRDSKAKDALEAFPNSKELTKEEAQERTELVQEAREMAREERISRQYETSKQIIRCITGTPEQRREALRELEEATRQDLHSGIDNTSSVLRDLAARDLVMRISETKYPTDAAHSLRDLFELKDSFRSQTAQDALGTLDKSATLHELSTGSPTEREAALKRLQDQLSPVAKKTEEFRTKSASDILEEFGNKEAVAEARAEMKNFADKNFADADKAFEKLLDRTSSRTEIEEALQSLKTENDKRVRTIRSDAYNELTQNVEYAVKSEGIRDSLRKAYKSLSAGEVSAEQREEIGKQLKSDLQRVLLSAQERGSNSGIRNPQLEQLYKELSEDKSLKDLLTQIENNKLSKEAIEKFNEQIPDNSGFLNDLRLGRVLRSIKEDSRTEDFGKAAEALQKEVPFNSAASQWLAWTKAGHAVAKINHATSATDITDAHAELNKLIENKNKFAKHTLAALLISDLSPADKAKWYKSGNGALAEKPIFTANTERVQKLGADATAAMDKLKLQAVSELRKEFASKEAGKDDRNLLSVVSLALAHEHSKAVSSPELKKELESLIRTALNKYDSDAARDGVLDAVLTGAAGTKEIADLAVAGNPKFLESRLRKVSDAAFDGNEAAMRVMAAMTNGMLHDKLAESKASDLFEQLASSDGHRSKAMDALVHANQRHGDRGRLLETLGKVASKSFSNEDIAEGVKEAIIEGLASKKEATQRSANRGLLEVAQHWTENDVSALARHASRQTVLSLHEHAKDIPDDLRRQLVGKLSHIANPSDPADFEHKKSALQSLAVMGEYLSPIQLANISKFGGPDGLRLAQAAGSSPAEAQELQREAGKALVQTIARGTDEMRRQALTAFDKNKFYGISDNSELKDVLHRMALDQPYDLELFEKINSLVYDTALPRPAAGILKQWDVPSADNNELFEKARQVTGNYNEFEKGVSGDQMLRRIAANIELFNSLPPEMRATLFRSPPDESQPGAKELKDAMADPISAQNVVGQMLNGTLQESRNAFLLRDLESEMKQLHGQAAYERFQSQFDLKDIQEERNHKFDDLVKHTKEGVSFLEKAGYLGSLVVDSVSIVPINYDPFQDFDNAQSKLVKNLPGIEARIDKANARLANASNLENAYSFAGDVAKYTTWKNGGMQKEADLMLVKTLWGNNGQLLKQFSPSIYGDLFPSSSLQSGRGALTRLSDAGQASLPGIPRLTLGEKDSLALGVDGLRFLNHNKSNGDTFDVIAVRRQAFASIESSVGITKAGDISRKMGNELNEFNDLLRAATAGRKYDTLVNDMKDRAGRLQTIIGEVSDKDRQNIRADIKALEAALGAKDENFIKDKAAREGLNERLENLKNLEELFDPNSSRGKEFRKSLEEVSSPNFRADTAANWFKAHGPVILATCLAVGATIGACLTFGASSGLAIVAWSSVAGLAAEELTVYGLSKANANGYTGWGIAGQQNIMQKWYDKTGDDLGENVKSFFKEVALAYGERIGTDIALSLLTMGSAKFILSGLKPGSLALQSLRGIVAGEGKSLAQVAFQSQRAALIAEGRSTASQYMKEFLKNSGREMMENVGFTAAQITGETAIKDLSPEAWRKVMEESQTRTSFGLGTTLAVLQGLTHSITLRPGAGRITHFEATSPKAEAAFIKNYLKEGFSVKQVEPGKYHVWPASAAPGSAPFTLQRGIGTPPERVFPDNYKPVESAVIPPAETQVTSAQGHVWKQNELGAKALKETTAFSEHFGNSRFAEANVIAEGGYPAGHEVRRKMVEASAEDLQNTDKLKQFLSDIGAVAEIKSAPVDTASGAGAKNSKLVTELPQTVIEIAPGVKVDFLTGKTPGGKSLSPEMQAKFETFAKGEIGQRILAEHSLAGIEEKLHFHNLQNGGKIISPSYAKFARDNGAPGSALEAAFQGRHLDQYAESGGRAPFTFEQESILLLHDSNPKLFNADMLDRHFGHQYEGVRKPVIEWLKKQEAAKSADTGSTPEATAKHDPGAQRARGSGGSADATFVEPTNTGGRLGRNKEFDSQLRHIESQSTTYFMRDIPRAQQKPADFAQQAIYKKGNEFLQQRPAPDKPSLAEEGWAIHQSQKDSPADAAKMDYILINENTGQYHILDATAQTKDLSSQIRRDSIIKWEEPTHFDRESGLLTAKGVELVNKKIAEMARKESPLNLRDHPPPSFSKKDAAASVAELKQYREALMNSGNPDVLKFHGELAGSLTYWDKTAAKSLAPYKTADEAFQKQADKALNDVIAELFAGKNKASATADRRFTTDPKGKLTLAADGNRYEWNSNKAQKAFDDAFNDAIGKAKTNSQRDALYDIKRNGLPAPDVLADRVAAKLSTRQTDTLLGKDAAPPKKAPPPPTPPASPELNRHELMAAKSLSELNKQWGIKPEAGEFNQDVQDVVSMNLQNLREAQNTDPKLKPTVEAAEKMLDAYRRDNPEAVRRINDLFNSTTEPTGFRLGRNDTQASNELAKATKELGELIEKSGLDPMFFSDLQKSVAKQDGRFAELLLEHTKYLTEISAQLRDGKISSEQIDELGARIAHNLDDPDNAANLDGIMDAFVRSPQAQENVKSFERLILETPPASDLTYVPGSISYLSRSGWTMKLENGAPMTRDGKFVLSHEGHTRVYDRDQGKFKGWERGTKHPNGTIDLKSKGDISIEVEVAPSELLASMIGADIGGTNTCTACVTSFLKNASHPEGIGKLVASGSMETPRMLQNSAIGKVGDGGANVGYSQLMDFISTHAKMNPELVKAAEFGKESIRAVTVTDLSAKGPGIYVATSPAKENVTGDSMSHTWVVTVDKGGRVSMIDAYNGRIRNPDGFRFETLDRLSGPNAERAARNLGLK